MDMAKDSYPIVKICLLVLAITAAFAGVTYELPYLALGGYLTMIIIGVILWKEK